MPVLVFEESMRKARLKQNAKGEWLVWDPQDKKWLVIRGANALKDDPFQIDPRIDLTKPIYEQVLALEAIDKEALNTSSALSQLPKNRDADDDY